MAVHYCIQCLHEGRTVVATIPKAAERLCRSCKDKNLKEKRDELVASAQRVKKLRDRLRELFLGFSNEQQALFRKEFISPELVKSVSLGRAIRWCRQLNKGIIFEDSD